MKPTTILRAKFWCTSRKCPSSATALISARMSYGWFGDSGIRSSSAASVRLMSSRESARGGSSRLFDGMNDSSSRIVARQSSSDSAAKCATPEIWLCVSAPPSFSFVTSSCVTVLMTSGPVTNMYDVFFTIKVKRGGGGGGGGGEAAAGRRPPARAGGVVEADHRRAVLHRQVHDLHDLRGVGLAERPAEDGEVLREGVDEAPLHGAVAGDDAVAGNALPVHAEVVAAVDDELVELLKRAAVEEQLDALARRQLPLGVLPGDARLAAADLALALAALELLEVSVLDGRHRRPRGF